MPAEGGVVNVWVVPVLMVIYGLLLWGAGYMSGLGHGVRSERKRQAARDAWVTNLKPVGVSILGHYLDLTDPPPPSERTVPTARPDGIGGALP